MARPDEDVVVSVERKGPGGARPLPGTRSLCQLCKQPIVWARTMAGPNGPGGKSQPFDPYENPDGNVAIIPRAQGRLLARALGKDDGLDEHAEYRGMPHAATCKKPDPKARVLAPNVVDLAARRRAKDAR